MKFKTKIAIKQQNTSFQNEKQLLRQSLYSRMRITRKTVHDINKMEDNFALRCVFTYPGISRLENTCMQQPIAFLNRLSK
jgi:Tfp pilus assembly protein PilV